MTIGRDFSDIYVCACGEPCDSRSAGLEHEESCGHCQSIIHGGDDDDATLESAILELLSVCEKILKRRLDTSYKDDLTNAMLAVYDFIPDDNDQKSMGWVGQDGLP